MILVGCAATTEVVGRQGSYVACPWVFVERVGALTFLSYVQGASGDAKNNHGLLKTSKAKRPCY